jgi:hypothetical protein
MKAAFVCVVQMGAFFGGWRGRWGCGEYLPFGSRRRIVPCQRLALLPFFQRRINMSTISVNLDGLTVEIQRVQVPLKKLILDVENPRIQYYLDTRLNDNITQEKIKL